MSVVVIATGTLCLEVCTALTRVQTGSVCSGTLSASVWVMLNRASVYL